MDSPLGPAAGAFETSTDAGPLEVARGGYRFDPAMEFDRFLPPALRLGTSETSHFLVQFDGPIEAGWKGDLEGIAASIHDYLPSNTFLATLAPEGVSSMRAHPHVRAVVPYPPALKLDATLPPSGLIDATVLGFSDTDLTGLLTDLSRAGALPVAWTQGHREPVVDVRLDAGRLADVARLGEVAWIETARNVAEVDNEVASAVTQSGTPTLWSAHAHGVDGGSQVVSVCDTGVNTLAVGSAGTTPTVVRMDHEAFNGSQTAGLVEYNRHLASTPLPLPPHPKIALYYSPQENGNMGNADDEDGHGTQTAGTLAGDAGAWRLRDGHDGVAFASRLAVCDIATATALFALNDYGNYWLPAYDAGARVSSNSWGTQATNDYTIAARQQDAFVWDHRDFVLVRSMGNAGPGEPMRPEAVSKNVLAVGATLNDGVSEDLSPTSSGGPTADGRIKPDVVAPGRCLVSPTLPEPTSYACYSGTSAATPVVAGAAALVRDYFAKGFYPSGTPEASDAMQPSAALVRALLEVSGTEIVGDRGEGSYPNPAQGWGRVLLDDALFFEGDARRLWVLDEHQALATRGVAVSRLQVDAGQPLRVLLAWTDAPAAAGAASALVNDLDLVVVDPAGRILRGNAFVGDEVPPGQGAADRVNVEEGVYVNAPLSGRYYVAVIGANVPSGPQPFALAATGGVH